MPVSTNVPPIQFTLTGLVLPSESDVLNGEIADINSAFGGGLNPDLSTPQGQLASSLAAIIGDVNDQFAQFVNQIDPVYSAGRIQDAIGHLYNLERIPAAGTLVQCICTGTPGTHISIGSLAKDVSGNVYAAIIGHVIPSGGSVTIPFQCQTPGPIVCLAGDLNQIYQAIAGWAAITNMVDGTVGNDVESRNEFEARRQRSLALNATQSIQAIIANVLAVPNVIDAYGYENATNGTVNIGSTAYPTVAHSIYIAVAGGNANDIAAAIWQKKAPGCDYNGNTTIVVSDKSYPYPYPTYNVTFNIPTGLPIKFAVQIVNDPNLPSDIVTQVKNAISLAFNGQDGGARARIGSTLYASRYYAGIASISASVGLLSVLLGPTTATLTSFVVGVDKLPTLNQSDITVTLV